MKVELVKYTDKENGVFYYWQNSEGERLTKYQMDVNNAIADFANINKKDTKEILETREI